MASGEHGNVASAMAYVELKDVSKDYLSGVCLVDEESSQLIVSSWDGTASLYDWEKNKRMGRLSHEWPLTSIAVCTGTRRAYVGSAQGEVLELDWESERMVAVQGLQCGLGISAMGSYGQFVVVGSWDGSLEVVDTRRNSVRLIRRLAGKILSLDCGATRVVCMTTDGVYVFRTSDIDAAPERRESGLKYQSRCVRLVPDEEGYVQSSVDGRVAVEYFGDEGRKFAFRCHRMNLKDTQLVFPVNALCFHPKTALLYTGGSDGRVFAWNLTTRKKAEELPKVEDSVVKLCCNRRALVIAASDDTFKTSAVVEDIALQHSRVYVKVF
ncbi:AaceriAEL226Wp [[Ashbya] aceris (nom. inval.)]|nr:AaceriAEL226Wp [[Ashbya] aceris (nom. inval.)]